MDWPNPKEVRMNNRQDPKFCTHTTSLPFRSRQPILPEVPDPNNPDEIYHWADSLHTQAPAGSSRYFEHRHRVTNDDQSSPRNVCLGPRNTSSAPLTMGHSVKSAGRRTEEDVPRLHSSSHSANLRHGFTRSERDASRAGELLPRNSVYPTNSRNDNLSRSGRSGKQTDEHLTRRHNFHYSPNSRNASSASTRSGRAMERVERDYNAGHSSNLRNGADKYSRESKPYPTSFEYAQTSTTLRRKSDGTYKTAPDYLKNLKDKSPRRDEHGSRNYIHDNHRKRLSTDRPNYSDRRQDRNVERSNIRSHVPSYTKSRQNDERASEPKRFRHTVPSPTSISNSRDDDISESGSLSSLTSDEGNEDLEDSNIESWVRSAPAELYYERSKDGEMLATTRALRYCDKLKTQILDKARASRLHAEEMGKCEMEKQKQLDCAKHSDEPDDDYSDSYSNDSSDDERESRKSQAANRELERRKKHPMRMHEELWHNDPGLMNDGPVCRCSAKARRFGIRHGFYAGESCIPKCNPRSNNSDKLHHYRIKISPAKNFLVTTPTVILHDSQEYIFEGFSVFSHRPLDLQLPPCRVIRFNIRYDVFVEKEKFPESFCVQELELFEQYVLLEILELVDLKYDRDNDSCNEFHVMPRFVRQLPDNGKEILSMNQVLKHLIDNDKELIKKEKLRNLSKIHQADWQNFADRYKGTIVTKWGMKPSSLRVDQIDRNVDSSESGNGKDKSAASSSSKKLQMHSAGSKSNADDIPFPLIIHFGIRPPQLSYAGNAEYQRAWRKYVKYRHLLSNMAKPSADDKNKLARKELKLQQMRTASHMKRDVTVAISSEGFRSTGICCDIVQHAMLLPVLIGHLRFHNSLTKLEAKMEYTFSNRSLLQLAMTHPSYRENFGTNPDHARNSLTNCGIRQPEYGDRRIHYASTRKRGINTLINIMARFGAAEETESGITHNERLEFLGDAVVEFVSSIHLFHMFPDLEEGGLATYRAAIVQNQHLAVLAQIMELDQYMLYAHGSDLCHDSELRHAMANCFEALMGAIFIDGGIEYADKILAKALFGNEPENFEIWTNYKRHPLQLEEPNGDRHWIESHQVLQNLAKFEESIGIEFNHIRLLARAFTDRSLGYNNLTRGSNQRLEFLGDTVLQLISSEYLYRHFPDHHEGHLSLLRSSLVNNRTQSLVCDDLGMNKYAMRSDPKSEMKIKDRADLLEAFLGALYIDRGLKYCAKFCSVCFIPRLSDSITKQEWNDPKSKLQQCCLTLRNMDGKEPDIPVYKVIGSKGPTNSRVYTLAVSFRGERLASATGQSIQEAEMNAAEQALKSSAGLFPQLHHQKRVIDKTRKTN